MSLRDTFFAIAISLTDSYKIKEFKRLNEIMVNFFYN